MLSQKISCHFLFFFNGISRVGWCYIVDVPLGDEKILSPHCRYLLSLIFIWDMLGFPSFHLAVKMGEAEEREGKSFTRITCYKLRTPQTALFLLVPLLIEAGMNG